MDTAKGGIAEVELGKLAMEKAASAEVKQFAQRMVDDHGKANDELKTIAQSKNITLPTSVDPDQRALHDRLSKLSGQAFDRAYMQAMVADHRKGVSAFRTEAMSGKDPEFKAFASKTLPTLEDHMKMAEATSRQRPARRRHRSCPLRNTTRPAATPPRARTARPPRRAGPTNEGSTAIGRGWWARRPPTM
jgi:putative membrane protein